MPWGLLWRFHARHMYAGILLAVAAAAISWRLLAWMSPALIGLVLAVPVSAFMGSARAGRALARLGLLATPEERHPPPLAARRRGGGRGAARHRRAAAGRGRAARRPAGARPPPRLARRRRRPGRRARPDASLASALLKLADGLGPDRLDARESFAVLASARTLSGLAADPAAAAQMNDL